MRGIPAIWFALIVLSLLAALTFWIDHAVQPPQPKRDGSTRHDADYIINNFTSSRADAAGNPRYSLAGVEMRHYPDDDSTTLVRPAFAQYSAKKPTTRIEGQRGEVSSNGENVYFMDNVRMVRAAMRSKGELTVLTEYLHIVPDQDFVETDRPVTILQAPRTVIHANALEYYKKEGLLKLFGSVKVHYERPGAQGPALKIEQIAKSRKTAAAPAKVATEQVQKKTLTNNGIQAEKTSSKKRATKKKTANKPVTNTGKPKTRIRRKYANHAN